MTKTETVVEGPRERVVLAAARLLRTRGYAGTSLRDIVKKADAPWGSLQHYFPGGKDQIVAEAMAAGTLQVDEMIDEAFTRGRSAEAAVRRFFFKAAEVVEERDFDAGCPVALVALEHADGENEIARLSRASIDGWVARLAGHLRKAGIEARTSRRLASVIINQYEGALTLSRVGRDVQPLRDAGNAMRQLVADAS